MSKKTSVPTFSIIVDGKTITLYQQDKKCLLSEDAQYRYVGGFSKTKVVGYGELYKDSKKYLEGTWKNGTIIKGKKYDLKYKDELIFEGSFKNGLYHGEGILLVDRGEEKYEGHFKNGKKNGFGKNYFLNSKTNGWMLESEGNYKMDKLNGFGTEYFFNKQTGKMDMVFYMGNFKNGRFNGKGKRYNVDSPEPTSYTLGTFLNGALNGKATEFYENGVLKFKGRFEFDRRVGNCIEYYKSGKVKLRGKYVAGKLKKGKNYYNNEKNSIEYEGTYNGTMERKLKGVSYYENGLKSREGIWKLGFKKGTIYSRDAKSYEEGEYQLGKRNGYCKIYDNNILFDKGLWEMDKRKGLHYMYYDDGSLHFKGYFDYDKKGKGKEFYKDGTVKEEGVYRSGSLTGKGKKYYPDGSPKEVGEFFYGRLQKGSKYFENGEIIVGHYKNEKNEGKCTVYWSKKRKRSVGKWEEGMKNGLFVEYFSSTGKPSFKGMYKNGVKEGHGTEYNVDGTIDLKGYWHNGTYIGKVPFQTVQQKQRKLMVQENSIKKYMQTNDTNYLKKVKVDGIKKYLEKYAKKEVSGKSKSSLVNHLKEWRKQLKQEKAIKHTGPTVFDVLQSEDVPIKEFLKEEDRIILKEGNHYYGVYLNQTDIFYECKVPKIPFYEYIGNENVIGIIRLTTDQGKFYFPKTDAIIQDMKKGYNLFEFQTIPTDVRILSKTVALGDDFVSANHCDSKDLIKLSKTTKRKKVGKGLTLQVQFEF